MTGDTFLVYGALLCAMSGVPGLFLPRGSRLGQRIATGLLLAGNFLSARGVYEHLAIGNSLQISFPSPFEGARFSFQADGLSLFFLFPILTLSSLGSIYGISYWRADDHPNNSRKLSLFWGTLSAAMVLLVMSRDGMAFVFSWELMALSAFMLVSTDDHERDVRMAGWLYLAASHVATLLLFVMFALVSRDDPSLSFAAFAKVSPQGANTLFLIALVAFGIKAGIMPFHVWLPSSHAMAPSHVSALLSGVLIKMGIFGLLRVLSVLPTPPLWWGSLLLVLGCITGVLGIAYAIGQHDIKQALAYSSVENIGIITLGMGLAVMGRSLGKDEWVLLALGGALLHVWNHGLFKGLLFLTTGAVIHATHTRRMDLLGGLSRRMPQAASCFLVGAVAICGLPPLNGFTGELLIYLGLFRTLEGHGPVWGAALAVPALGLIGALALACFAKIYGVVFLGAARGPQGELAHDPSFTMLGPMWLLAIGCLVVGIAPGIAAPVLGGAIDVFRGADAPDLVRTIRDVAPWGWMSAASGALLAALVVGAVCLWTRLGMGRVDSTVTWDCGYAAPSAKMQYTSSSFSQMLVELFRWGLWAEVKAPRITNLFPPREEFQSTVPDAVLDRGIRPFTRAVIWLFSWFRYLQQGSIHAYLFYIFAVLVLLLFWRSA